MRSTAVIFAALAFSGFVAGAPAAKHEASGVSSTESTGTGEGTPSSTGGSKGKHHSTNTGKPKTTTTGKPKTTTTGKPKTTTGKPKTTTTGKAKPTGTGKPSDKGLYGTDMDKARCYWQSDDSLYVSWVITMPEYKGNSVKTMEGNFKGSIDQNSACRGITPAIGMKEWYAVGASNSTALFSFSSSDFCTAYQMTNVIKDTTGNIQNTACVPFGDAEGGSDPDPSNLDGELPEGGDDGDDGMFKRDDTPKPKPISDSAMAKLLQMPEDSTHAELVQKLQGPSPIDKHPASS